VTEAVRIRDLRFRYRHAPAPALRGVDFDLARGEYCCIMGPTGAGKTTFARCINGIVPHFFKGEISGEVSVFGTGTLKRKVAEISRDVGMILQDFESQIFSTDVLLEVAFGMENLGVPRGEMKTRVRQALDTVGLAGFEHRETAGLSGGEKQRLAIASVLAMRPGLLVFDEPTTDLDPVGKAEVFSLLRRIADQGRTVVLIEHEAQQAQTAGRIHLMRDGVWAAQGAPHEILGDPDLLESNSVRPPDLAVIADHLGVALPDLSLDAAEQALKRIQLRWDEHKYEGVIASTGAPSGEDLFAIEGLTFSYGHDRPALRDLELRIGEGEFVAIVGPNGSGKTTLVKHLNGLLRPGRGRVRFKDADLAGMGVSELGRRIGFVFQNPDHQIFCATCREEIEFGLRNYGYAPSDWPRRVEGALARVALDGYGDRDPFVLTKGERQRLAVASVLACEPEVIILDEPTTGLDYPEQAAMMDLLRSLHAQGHTVIIVTHTMWVVARYAPRTVLMIDGKIAADGDTRAVMHDAGLLSRARLAAPGAALLASRLGRRLLTPGEFKLCTIPGGG